MLFYLKPDNCSKTFSLSFVIGTKLHSPGNYQFISVNLQGKGPGNDRKTLDSVFI